MLLLPSGPQYDIFFGDDGCIIVTRLSTEYSAYIHQAIANINPAACITRQTSSSATLLEAKNMKSLGKYCSEQNMVPDG